MRKKIFDILNKIYGVLMAISFFGGVLPLIPFLVALAIGGEAAEKISVFCSEQYYPWVIIVGSIAVIFGVIAMYVGKLEGLSVKSVTAEKKEEEPKEETEEK